MKMLIIPPAMPIRMQEINFTYALIHAYRGSIIEEINQSHMEEWIFLEHQSKLLVFTSSTTFFSEANQGITITHHISQVICIFIRPTKTMKEDRGRFSCTEACPEPQFL